MDIKNTALYNRFGNRLTVAENSQAQMNIERDQII
jgi:hypothetical protein